MEIGEIIGKTPINRGISWEIELLLIVKLNFSIAKGSAKQFS